MNQFPQTFALGRVESTPDRIWYSVLLAGHGILANLQSTRMHRIQWVLLTLWTKSIKIKAIKLQADFNDRQSSISDVGSRRWCCWRGCSCCCCCCCSCLWGRWLCLVALMLGLPVSVVAVVVLSAVAVAVVAVVMPCVDFRRKCFLNIVYILWGEDAAAAAGSNLEFLLLLLLHVVVVVVVVLIVVFTLVAVVTHTQLGPCPS